MKSKEIKFIGIGGAFSKKYNNNSAYIIKGNRFILFDCGEDIFKQILKQNLIKSNIKEIDIIITHTHSDHIGSLETMLFYCRYRKIKPTVIFPNKELIRDFLKLQGMTISNFELKSPSELKRQYKLKEYEQVHGDIIDGEFKAIESYGYHYIDDEYNFFFSGDTNKLSEKVRVKFLNGEIEHLYHEVDTTGWPTHIQMEELILLIPISERNRVTLMHISDKFDFKNTNGFLTAKEEGEFLK